MKMRLISLLASLLCVLTCLPARAQEQRENVILSVSPTVVRWAAVYKVLPVRPDDPYFHVRVFERQKGWKPWMFKELAFHNGGYAKSIGSKPDQQKGQDVEL